MEVVMQESTFHLTANDRNCVDEFRTKGVHNAREVNRAHILACLDQGVSLANIMAVLGVGRTAVWRCRAAYFQGGWELAVFDQARSGRPVVYNANARARLLALARSAPPRGRTRRTVAGLERAAAKDTELAGISRETIRRILFESSS